MTADLHAADLPTVLLTVTATGAGLTGGVFLAFSTFVMTALRRLPTPDGIRAMQQINRAAPQPLFLLILLGTAVLGALTAVLAVTGSAPGNVGKVIGGLLSTATAAITIVFHVPRNNALAAVGPDTAGADRDWQRYLRVWIPGNHLRTLTSASSCVLLIVTGV